MPEPGTGLVGPEPGPEPGPRPAQARGPGPRPGPGLGSGFRSVRQWMGPIDPELGPRLVFLEFPRQAVLFIPFESEQDILEDVESGLEIFEYV